MLINVMQPGSLAEGGLGACSAIKVRLVHALIRRHVELLERPGPWPAAYGKPINQ